jgi:hypothetical protein
LSASQALLHPYFAGLHDPGDEPIFPFPLPDDPELDVMPVAQVRLEVAREIIRYNPDLQGLMAP